MRESHWVGLSLQSTAGHITPESMVKDGLLYVWIRGRLVSVGCVNYNIDIISIQVAVPRADKTRDKAGCILPSKARHSRVP